MVGPSNDNKESSMRSCCKGLSSRIKEEERCNSLHVMLLHLFHVFKDFKHRSGSQKLLNRDEEVKIAQQGLEVGRPKLPESGQNFERKRKRRIGGIGGGFDLRGRYSIDDMRLAGMCPMDDPPRWEPARHTLEGPRCCGAAERPSIGASEDFT
ncbi:hypothetical protein E3N88_32707 [Mikania micrantha]|uniref:Uncharacterized protein n=1 Tax=Mikania micrantha TaxID=192012 RepID=A0A5N6M9Q3_9ASTR|nr:hypothetical protein E3N88_32707 [Mikania micrantha]